MKLGLLSVGVIISSCLLSLLYSSSLKAPAKIRALQTLGRLFYVDVDDKQQTWSDVRSQIFRNLSQFTMGVACWTSADFESSIK